MADLLGVPPEQFRAALGDRALSHIPDMALWLVTGAASAAGTTSATLPGLPAPDIALPWSADPGPELLARRRAALGRALEACRFRDAPWFPELAAALERTADRLAEPRTTPAPGPVLMEDAS